MSNAAKITVEFTRKAVIIFESMHLDQPCCDEFRYAIEHDTISMPEDHEYLSIEEEWDPDQRLCIEAPNQSPVNRVRQAISRCPFCGANIHVKVELEEDL